MGEKPLTQRPETWVLHLGLPPALFVKSSNIQVPRLQEEWSQDSCFLEHDEVQGGEPSPGV